MSTHGPYIVWCNFGYDGWHPYSYATLDEAMVHRGYEDRVITRVVEYKVAEIRRET